MGREWPGSRPCACCDPAPRLHPDHRDPRRPVRRYILDRLHPTVHLPRRPAAPAPVSRQARPRRRPAGRERLAFRPRLRRNPAALANLCARASTLQQGFDGLQHIWEFYLAYCEAAFTMGNTDVMQFTLQAAGMWITLKFSYGNARVASPWLRPHFYAGSPCQRAQCRVSRTPGRCGLRVKGRVLGPESYHAPLRLPVLTRWAGRPLALELSYRRSPQYGQARAIAKRSLARCAAKGPFSDAWPAPGSAPAAFPNRCAARPAGGLNARGKAACSSCTTASQTRPCRRLWRAVLRHLAGAQTRSGLRAALLALPR